MKNLYELFDGYVVRTDENNVISAIPLDETNSDYQAYLAYVANGNKEPASTLPSNSSIPQAGE
jgi:hypothetical protein